ncbi:MAG: hypothetical protein M3O86_01025, partial [Actinomycetota bacterium]|nr:hypothetical protein [Actinomycetota bacterium]
MTAAVGLRRWLLVLTVAASLLPLGAGRAYACSCAYSGPREMLAAHDAAFIGSVADIRDAGAGRQVWTFAVERWVKGDLGPSVEVDTASSGASCGFELKHGEEAAIFLSVEADGTASGGLCSTLDADAVREYLRPQRAEPDAKATIVVAGGSGRVHLWLFDDRGALAGSVRTPRDDYLEDFDVCPGGRRAVELWERRVVVRDLATLRRARTVRVPGAVDAAFCRDRNGRDVVVALRDDASGNFRALARLDDLDRPLVRGDWVAVDVVGDDALATVGRDHTELQRLSLGTGARTVLHRADDDSGAVLTVPPSIEGFAVSPDGRRVAFEVTRYAEDAPRSSEVFVYRVRDGRLLGRADFAVEGGEVRWLDAERLVLTSYEHGPLVLDSDGLTVQAELPDAAGWVAVTAMGRRLVGMDGPRLSAVTPSTGAVTVLATVPTQFTGWIERLPQPLRVSAKAAKRSETTTISDTVDRVDTPSQRMPASTAAG